jgi:adenine-specific DNA-methyltransferase
MANERARALRQNLTDAERRLWFHLRRKQLNGHRFRRQVPIGPYIADFVCLDAKLVIEVDGGQHSDNAANDARRTALMEAQGFRVIRFWNDEVLGNTDGVLDTIRLRLADPPPKPTPTKGEGIALVSSIWN